MTSTSQVSALEVVDGIAVIRITGHCRFGSAVRLVASALEQVCAARHGLCLIEGLELGGFGPPSVAARLEMVRAWAEVAGGLVVCAIIEAPIAGITSQALAVAPLLVASLAVLHLAAAASARLRA